ncbi:MAG TPA: carboxypeptidase-like regulatory domain-containing protein, partial [Vicinamibacterales bacterium]|nr:carboxypeptidase-like regulatory domain-containing protein [Vicinamibacterales bacterium]
DLGHYRLWGLPPGEYYVRARIGGRFDVADGPDPGEPGAQTGYAPVYYPGSAALSDAQRIRVEAGQETSGIDFVLVPIPVVRVAGRVLDSAGRPVSEGFVLLMPRGPDDRAVIEPGPAARLGDGGTFSFANVVPGDYTLVARAGRPGGRRRGDGTSEPAEAASVRLTVGPGGATDLLVTTGPGARIAGRVVFQGQSPPPGGLDIIAVPAELGELGGSTTTTAADGTFTLAGVYGAVLLRVAGRPQPWVLKAVELEGQDVTDVPLDASRGDITGVRLVLTDRPSGVTGLVRDAGAPAADSVVIVFADDPARWAHGAYSVFTAVPDQRGQFSLGGLRPGSYRAAALVGIDLAEARDVEVLERLRPLAEPFRLREGETLTLDLTPRPAPQS